jgi:peptide-methionine (S)-S-oxide reductase
MIKQRLLSSKFSQFATGLVMGLFCLISVSSAWALIKTNQNQVATFAAGSFLYIQPIFDKTPGVIKTVVGYAGGNEPSPIFEEVSLGQTDYFESIQVTYDPEKVTYQTLLNTFWHNIDPENNEGQFCDKGAQYRTVIFYHDDNQYKLAQSTKQAILASHQVKSITTEIRPYTTFYPAEDYLQQYYKKNPIRYKYYRFICRPDKRLAEIWHKNI